jgi:hypothetical protein
MAKINSNENKNIVEVPEEKLKELGILKVLNIIISEEGEDNYNCVMETGEIKTVPASSLIKE